MEGKTRQYACVAVAAAVVVAGTVAAGLLPSSTRYQVVAGGIIVLGFAIAYACVGAE